MISTVIAAGALAGTLHLPLQGAPAFAPAAEAVLSGLVQEALARNPDLRAAEDTMRAARERPAQLSALTDPALGLIYTNEGWSPTLGATPDSSLAIMASQDLPYPGKRRLRGEIASLAADEIAQQVERMRLGISASVRRAYFRLLEARAVIALTEEQADVWKQIEGVTRARYAVGQGGQQDVLRTQVELTRVGQVLAEQASDATIGLAEINRLRDRAPETAVASPGALEEPPPIADPGAEADRIQAASPERVAAAIAVDRARRAIDLAKRESRPDFTVTGAYMSRGALDPMWQAGVTVSLPIRKARRSAAVAESEALLAAAQSRAAAVDVQLRSRTHERLAELDAARKVTALYREGIVPQDRMSVESAMASYQAGRVPFVTVLEALTTLYGDRVTLVRLLAAQSRIGISLEEASLERTADLPVTRAATTEGAVGSMAR